MSLVNRAEKLPKFKGTEHRITKRGGRPLASGRLSGTVSGGSGAIALPPGVNADGRYMGDHSGALALLVADAKQDAFALLSSSPRAIDLAGRQAPGKEK
jgi:hypothetical protein